MSQKKAKQLILLILRIAIGWHFLYEGFSKVFAKGWSAESFLNGTSGFISPFYHWLASDMLIQIVDVLNIAGLIIIGLALFLGIAIRAAAGAGLGLLTLYYFAYPPFGLSGMMQGDGNLFLVNSILIEAAALSFFVFQSKSSYSIENLIKSSINKNSGTEDYTGRRDALKNLATLPLLGVMGWGAFSDRKKHDVDISSGATIQFSQQDLSELKGDLPTGKIGEHNISRLVAGGNLIGGWAHSRDLRYVPELFRAYNTEKKVFETLMLAENAGINTINIGFSSNEILQKYKKATGSKIKVISQVAPDMKNKDYFKYIDKAIDYGADIIQIQGNWCDWLVRDGKYEVIVEMMDHIRKQGYTAGLASHTVDSLILCEKQGIIPDYYMKTMHHDNYWSAHPRENRKPFEVDGKRSSNHNEFHDNLFCLFPDKTVDFVNRSKVPVMGFKVLAAGAIKAEDGFNWAFRNGADFICVGMFDFQIVRDVNITLDVLGNMEERERKWYG